MGNLFSRVFDTECVGSLFARTQRNGKRFSPLRENMLFVSIHFSLEKDSVVFSAFVNYNIMLCIEFSSLRLKCDMGEVF